MLTHQPPWKPAGPRRRAAVRASEIIRSPGAFRPSNSEIANAIVDAQHHLDRCRDAFGGEGGLGSTGFRACIRDGVRRQRLPASAHGIRAKFPIAVQ